MRTMQRRQHVHARQAEELVQALRGWWPLPPLPRSRSVQGLPRQRHLRARATQVSLPGLQDCTPESFACARLHRCLPHTHLFILTSIAA